MEEVTILLRLSHQRQRKSTLQEIPTNKPKHNGCRSSVGLRRREEHVSHHSLPAWAHWERQGTLGNSSLSLDQTQTSQVASALHCVSRTHDEPCKDSPPSSPALTPKAAQTSMPVHQATPIAAAPKFPRRAGLVIGWDEKPSHSKYSVFTSIYSFRGVLGDGRDDGGPEDLFLTSSSPSCPRLFHFFPTTTLQERSQTIRHLGI